MKKKYTDEENIQILIALLKEHNIKKIIVSPGTTHLSFVSSVQSDDYFELYSCVDERSATYMACGLSEETGEPVVITCTGATASRNYLPGLTEAYYNKIPIVAVTATQHLGKVGQNIPQVLDRSSQMKDIVKKSIQLNIVKSEEDRWSNNLKINDVLLECRRNGGGPVHINMETTYSNNFITGSIPKQRVINRYTIDDILPKIENVNSVAIFVGNHTCFNDNLTKLIEEFCEKYNAIVICDQSSNYNGKYKILGNLIFANAKKDYKTFDLLIDIGNISGAYMEINPNEIWRVNPDGELRDTYKKLSKVFSMTEEMFFLEYNRLKEQIDGNSLYLKYESEDKRLREKLEKMELPFSNPFIVKNTIKRIEEDSVVHLAILNTLRSWNYYKTDKKIKFYSNTGGFGIDGIMSTAIGTSLGTSKKVYCFIGDLAFFYDLNSLGNINVKNNLRIMMINNGCGAEFHLYNHRATKMAKENGISQKFAAADGHFGNKSDKLVKHMAEDLGFKYMSANDKKEFLNNVDEFVNGESDKPIIFEIFTTSEDESKAQEMIASLEVNTESIAKNTIKKVFGEKGIKAVKKILGR